MIFKKLDMFGFKSFAEKTHLKLEEGMTCIVGPNGCGKSNIADAIRWVLGEQSAKTLRSTRMEDVIFNGSEERHPLGMAEVSLVLDNSSGRLPVDYNEVIVSRRVYRSGESEYLLNKNSCRLRDIAELFMDTGLGAHAYSMIGQGQIDLVLSSKPEDRRYLFDAAAGILKYKSRKAAATRKLELAENNLLRLNDVINEVRRQLRSIRRQVGAARRYKERQEQLKTLELRRAFVRYSALATELSKLERNYTEISDKWQELSAQLSKSEATREELGITLIDCDKRLVAARERVHETASRIEKTESRVSILKERLNAMRGVDERAVEEIKMMEADLASAESELGAEQEKKDEAQRDLSAQKGILKAKEEEVSATVQKLRDVEQQIEQIRSESVHIVSSSATARAELDKLGAALEEAEKDSVRYAGDENALATTLDEMRQEMERLLSRIETEKEEHTARQSTYADKKADRDKLDGELTETERSVADTKESLSAARSRLESLNDLKEKLEGYYEGVRAVIFASKEGTLGEGVFGPVAEILSTDTQYEAAVEALLGNALQHVVTDTRETAQRCIAFLSSEKKGRASFLPLETLNRRQPPAMEEAIRQRDEVVCAAADCIRVDEQYQGIKERLVGNALIVRTLEDACRIVEQFPDHPDLATLNGELIAADGVISGGGTAAEGGGLLGRATEIERLEAQTAELERTVEAGREKMHDLNASLATLEDELSGIERRLHDDDIELAGMNKDSDRKRAEIERVTTDLESLRARVEEVRRRKAELETRRGEVRENIQQFDEKTASFERNLAEATRLARSISSDIDTLSAETTNIKITISAAEQSVVHHETETKRLTIQRDEFRRKIDARNKDLNQSRSIEHDVGEEIKEAGERAKHLIEMSETERKAAVDTEAEREQLVEAVENCEKELKEVRANYQEFQARNHEVELVLSQQREHISRIEEHAQREYSVAPGDLTAEQVGEDDYSDEQRDTEIAQIRERLAKMGPVNLMAIEENEELEKRLEFLVQQQADLDKAKENLYEVIKTINATTERMFLETFENAREYFHETFRSFFGGGRARLLLTDESDVLESGIEIEVRPPGKKMQSISLLSGGERAMTAIALIFAVFKCHPSPFCVLDEVDAPLDDVNIGRFLDLLEKFLPSTQFIVITHNKKTMEQASVLYGVTMAEKGVSQIVSVKFREAAAMAEPTPQQTEADADAEEPAESQPDAQEEEDAATVV